MTHITGLLLFIFLQLSCTVALECYEGKIVAGTGMEFQSTRECGKTATKCVVAKLVRDGVTTYAASCLPKRVHKYCRGNNKSSVFDKVHLCCCDSYQCNNLKKAKGCWETKSKGDAKTGK